MSDFSASHPEPSTRHGDDAAAACLMSPELEPAAEPAAQPKTDINALKNEILTNGMQAAAGGDTEALQELVMKFGFVSIPHDRLINMYNTLGYTMLHYAIMYKRINCITTLIELGADIERPTNLENKDTPLLLSIRFFNSCPSSYREEEIKANKLEVVKQLISLGCKVNALNKASESPIILATTMQNLELIQALTKRPELAVNARGLKGKTPLHMVAATNNYEIAQILLHHGADVHLKDTSGLTPLHVACHFGSFNIVELIFKERPESTDTLLMEVDRVGNIPLMIAKKSPHNSAAIIKFLISYNVELQYTNELGETLLHIFGPTDNAESSMIIAKRDATLLTCRNIYRQTPLHSAAIMGHKESLLVFIRQGADISVRDNDEMTPLMLAIKAGNVEIVSVMLDLGCDIHSEAKSDKSLIVWAIENEYTALLKALIERDDRAAKQSVDDEGNTFMHVAARSGALRSIQVLNGSIVTEGLVHSENDCQQTPLHVAAQHGNLQCFKELLDGGAEASKADKEGNNALHMACIHGQLHVAQFLVQTGSSAELSNGQLGNPLSCAAYHGHDHVVKFLLGRDVSCNGSYAELKVSPLLLATGQGHIKVVMILLDHPRIDVTLTNKAGYNALAEAIIKGHSEIALEILNSVHWDKAMRMCTDNSVTPMRLLIEHMPDLATIVLNKCITSVEQEINGTPSVTQMIYNYEFIDDFDEPQLGMLGSFLLKRILRYKPNSQGNYIPLTAAAENGDHNMLMTTLSRKVSVSVVPPPLKNWGPNVYDKSRHTMSLMVKSKRIELLQHPLVAELLNHKWNKLAMPSFLLQLMFFILFLGILTPYVLLLPNPRGDVCAQNDADDDCLDLSSDKRRFLSVATVFLVILSCFNLSLEGLQIYYRRLDYLTDWQNYVEIIVSTLTICFVLSVRFKDCFCPNSSQWQLGSVVIFLSWIDLVLLMKSVPFVAISVNMLINVARSFLKLMFLSFLLIISFGIPLFLLFHEPELNDAFETVEGTFLKSIIMTTGELDFDDNFITRHVNYPFLYCFWIVFVVAMPILFNNLLVGLAVGDTQEELEKATLTKLALQVDVVTELEERLPSLRLYFLKKFNVLTRQHGKLSKLPFLPGKQFHSKMKAVFDSSDKSLSVIEEYQKRNPIEEIKEKLKEQENEISLLKEIIVKGFKGLSLKPKKSSAGSSEDAEMSTGEMTSYVANVDEELAEDQTGPNFAPPVPDLF